MFNLDAEDQLDFVTIYGSSKEGWMSTDWQKPTDNIIPLLDAVVETIPDTLPQGVTTNANYFFGLL